MEITGYEVPFAIKDAVPLKMIDGYFKGGEDPFGTDNKYTELSELECLKQFKNK
ncbi:hypothetical protein ABI125_11355 [Tamlana crocina]